MYRWNQERLQGAALGQRNATVRDCFYASAAATPTLVFPSLIRNARNHSKMIRTKKLVRVSRNGSRTILYR
jgi:CRISPR-associated protein Csd1